MLDLIGLMFSYPFFTRAALAGCALSLCSSLLGVNLVLRKYSMIGDGLSHVGFGAICIAAALNASPLYVCIPIVSLTAILLLRLGDKKGKSGDSSIAMISVTALSLGVIIATLSSDINADLNGYLFGSILAMAERDVRITLYICLVILTLFILCYNKLFAITFDEDFARATGIRVSFYNTLMAILSAITIVLGMRMMGALLISGLIIFPALTAMSISKSFLRVVITAGIISVLCFLLGLMFSFAFFTPAGPTIILINALCCCIFHLIAKVKKA